MLCAFGKESINKPFETETEKGGTKSEKWSMHCLFL